MSSLDEDKLEALRRWGEGLRQEGAGESAAAGRAILLLVEEVDRLRIELSQARRAPSLAVRASADEAAEQRDEPASTLYERLVRRERPVEDDETTVVSDATAPSPQSWIEALRRQK